VSSAVFLDQCWESTGKDAEAAEVQRDCELEAHYNLYPRFRALPHWMACATILTHLGLLGRQPSISTKND